MFAVLLAVIIYFTPAAIPPGFPLEAKPITAEAVSTEFEQIRFTDKTLDKGLDFVHHQGDEQLGGVDETLGSGACAADFNNDGWVDLFLVNGSGHTRFYGKEYWWQKSRGNVLFLNENGKIFKDATLSSGLQSKIWGMGCIAADFDNDGDTDLLLTGKEDRLLYRNNGNGKFSNISLEIATGGQAWSTSAAVADFNKDGLLDIYIANFIDFQKGKKTYEANSQFATQVNRTFNASLYEPQANFLFQNLGGLKFKEVSQALGVDDRDGRSLDVSWQDINQDGWSDLVITNDKGTGSNTAYYNQQGRAFITVPTTTGLRSALGNRGIGSGDLNADGLSDMVFGSPLGESSIALVKELSADGQYRYKDLSRELGIASNEFMNLSAWSALVQDFNNDGLNDVFIANGMLEPDADTGRVSQGQRKQILMQGPHNFYTDITESAGIALLDKQSARGVVSADFDNDGDVDLFVVHNNDLGQYLDNESPAKHWLGVKLVGQTVNKDAIGATVTIYTDTGKQSKSLVSGEGFLSDSDKRLIFGLNQQLKVLRLEVSWPDGTLQKFSNLDADRYWQITQNQSQPQDMKLIAAQPDKLEFPFSLGVQHPELRLRYLDLFTSKDLDDNAWKLLNIAANDADATLRRAAILKVSQQNTLQGLTLLVNALEDTDTGNVIAAINGLKAYEDEISIRWLLRQFSHPEPAVKITLANCFGYFFQEEEAVVHRKYLALPYLIRLLEDNDAKLRIAAANALANAERYRGVHELLKHVNDADPAVRSAVVRTLGLIRQTVAVTPLLSLLADAQQDDAVLAEVFIALRRLGDTEAYSKLEDYVNAKAGYAEIPLAKRLHVLNALLQQPEDAGVLDYGRLANLAKYLFEQSIKNNTVEQNKLVWLQILAHAKSVQSINWLEKQTHDSDAALRLAAYKTLLQISPDQNISLLKVAWQDKDLSIVNWALPGMLKAKIPLLTADYRKILADETMANTLWLFWDEFGFSGSAFDFISAVLPQAKSIAKSTVKAGSSGTAAEMVQTATGGLEGICYHQSAEINRFCALLAIQNKQLAARQLLVSLLQDKKMAASLRLSLLDRYQESFDPNAINVLYLLAQDKKDPLYQSVMLKLLGANNQSLLGFAEKTAQNVNEDNQIRFAAIEYLLRNGQPQAEQLFFH